MSIADCLPTPTPTTPTPHSPLPTPTPHSPFAHSPFAPTPHPRLHACKPVPSVPHCRLGCCLSGHPTNPALRAPFRGGAACDVSMQLPSARGMNSSSGSPRARSRARLGGWDRAREGAVLPRRPCAGPIPRARRGIRALIEGMRRLTAGSPSSTATIRSGSPTTGAAGRSPRAGRAVRALGARWRPCTRPPARRKSTSPRPSRSAPGSGSISSPWA